MEMIEIDVKDFKWGNKHGFGILCYLLKKVLEEIEYRFEMENIPINYKKFIKKNRIKKIDMLNFVNKDRPYDSLYSEGDFDSLMYDLSEHFEVEDVHREIIDNSTLTRLDKIIYYFYKYGENFDCLFEDWMDEDLYDSEN